MKLKKTATGIPGFDHIADGGLPIGRSTLVAGTAGSSKTLFGCQYLAMGIRLFNEAAVFVTFEEQIEDIRSNMRAFNWDIDAWEKEGLWKFVDASLKADEHATTVGEYDLRGFIARLERAITAVGAKRVVVDSIGSIYSHFPDLRVVRRELFNTVMALRKHKVTSIITAERTEEYGAMSRNGVEEFIADNVVILRNVLSQEKRRRTIEILKFRGTSHRKGENPFTIMPDEGVVIIPLSAMELKQNSSNTRVTSGNNKLDEMCGGGFYRDSIILVSGATGAGKTLLTTSFINAAREGNDKCLLFAFEESKEQLFRNAKGWGMDFDKLEKDGFLKVICVYPEVCSLEEHLLNMKRASAEFKPSRIAIDSLSALTRSSTEKGFQEFVIALTSFLKQEEITGIMTATTPFLTGGTSVTEGNISTITDSIILLRYVELYGVMKRSILMLKMRGSKHDSSIREFSINDKGMDIGNPFEIVSGILTGNPVAVRNEA